MLKWESPAIPPPPQTPELRKMGEGRGEPGRQAPLG